MVVVICVRSRCDTEQFNGVQGPNLTIRHSIIRSSDRIYVQFIRTDLSPLFRLQEASASQLTSCFIAAIGSSYGVSAART
jgi:hypothetical protein